jgi:hypothetical protein
VSGDRAAHVRDASADDRVRAAIVELRSIRSADPCAAIAMATIKATIHTLETRWLSTDRTPGSPPRSPDDT